MLVLLCAMATQSVQAVSTLDMLQQRVAEGDPVAQTLIGLMYENGYQFEKSNEKAKNWYKKGAAGGDEFAKKQLASVGQSSTSAKTSRAALIAARSKSRTSSSSGLTTASIFETAAMAELVSGSVDLEELQRERSSYVGKVIKLKFEDCSFYSSGTSTRLAIYSASYDSSSSATRFRDYLSFSSENEGAVDWAADSDDRNGSLYVYVEENKLYPLGDRKKKQGRAMSYTW